MHFIVMGLAALLLLLNYQFWLADGQGLPKLDELNQAVAAQQQENGRLRERNAALEAEVNSLKNGLAAIEERARVELGLVRQDETFFRILDEGGETRP